jgi:hypothetical protein
MENGKPHFLSDSGGNQFRYLHENIDGNGKFVCYTNTIGKTCHIYFSRLVKIQNSINTTQNEINTTQAGINKTQQMLIETINKLIDTIAEQK